jgi:hypothetical protein
VKKLNWSVKIDKELVSATCCNVNYETLTINGNGEAFEKSIREREREREREVCKIRSVFVFLTHFSFGYLPK